MWSNGATTANISGLAAGDYTVTVKDTNCCSATATYTVEEAAGITCTQPTGIAVVVDTNSAIYSWDLESDATNTQLQYRIPPNLGGGSQGTVISGPGTTLRTLNGLTPGA